MGRWAAGDGDIKRTSVDDQTDGKSTIWTDTFAIDDATTGLRLVSYRLRLTLYRKPGTRLNVRLADDPEYFDEAGEGFALGTLPSAALALSLVAALGLWFALVQP